MPNSDVALDSPRLAALARELEAGNDDALAAFWPDLEGNAPLVEPIPGEDRQRRVTFLWRGDEKTTRVALVGGLPAENYLSKALARLANTDLWFLTETHPVEARFEYHFRVNAPVMLPWNREESLRILDQFPGHGDPLNPHTPDGASYVELPGAPPQPWIVTQPDLPHGTMTKQTFKSEILNAEYPLILYTPPGYDPKGRRCWLMIAFDGGFPMMEVSLDNLLAAGKIPPLVVVGVGNISPETRHRDLGGYEPFARFLVNELIPWAREGYRVHPDAAHTIVGGISRGGLMAVTFYLEIGRYEMWLRVSWLSANRHLRDVLEAKGYRVTYSEFVGGHDGVCWRGSFADAVMALTTKRKG